jgi:hypothetical protein
MYKTIAITTALLALATATVNGGIGDLINSFPNHPIGSRDIHYGLAADTVYLYSYSYSYNANYYVYQMLRSNGSLVNSYPCPLGTTAPERYCRGMDYGGAGYIYMVNYNLGVSAQFYASNGSLISTWAWGSGTRYAVCREHNGYNAGPYIWYSYSDGSFWRYTTTGSLVSSFDIENTYNYDMTWDTFELIWYANWNDDHVHCITTTGSTLFSWRVPEAVSNPYGIAFYGPYIYVSTSAGTPDEYIWVYHRRGSGVAPASMGRIKAVFR